MTTLINLLRNKVTDPLIGTKSTGGPFAHDCRIAAIMLENGVETIFTKDTEFRRIPALKVVNPLDF